MVRHIGLPAAALKGNLDQAYLQNLLWQVRESSLDAAIILAQEQVYTRDGQLRRDIGTAHVPNDYVLELARRHPEFLPAVSIHPARNDALEELDRCIREGAVMMKCLPNCQDIDCRDSRYTRFWERMAEAGLPLLAHTGGEHTLPVVRPELADPRTLQRPLECGVTVIAAHCAGKSGLFDREYFEHLAQMFRRYPNLYADNSAFHIPIRSRIIPRTLAPDIQERIIHGSDFPVPIYGHWARLRGSLPRPAFRQWQRCRNVIERDFQFKKAMGFADATFTRIGNLLPPASLERWRARRASTPTPGREAVL